MVSACLSGFLRWERVNTLVEADLPILTRGIFSVAVMNWKAIVRFWLLWITIRGFMLYLGVKGERKEERVKWASGHC